MNRRSFLQFAASLPLAGALANLGEIPGKEGDLKQFKQPDGLSVTCRLVRNTSGGRLLARRLVAWRDGKSLKQVGGYANGKNQMAGIVMCGRNGVANGRLFWLAVGGMVKIEVSSAALSRKIWK